jgi:hypothetical protein
VHGSGKIKKTETMRLRAWDWRRIKSGEHLCAWVWRRIKKRRAPMCMGLEKNKKAESSYVHGTGEE